MRIRFFLLLFCVISTLLLAQDRQLVIPVNQKGTIQDISETLFILEDVACQFDSSHFQATNFLSQFSKAPILPNFGYTNSCYWAAFSLEGSTNQEAIYLWMEGTTVLQDVQLYMEQLDGSFQLFTYNHLQPISQRSIPLGTTPVFKLPVFNGERTFYLRQQTNYYMTFSLKVMDEVGYLKQVGQFQQIGIFFLTLFFTISFLLFLVAILMKIPFIGWISLHIFAIGFSIFVHYGFGVEWLWKDAMVLNYHLGVFSLHVISLTILLYLKPFLVLNNWWKNLYKLLIGLAILLSLFSCWLPYNHLVLKSLESLVFISLLGMLFLFFPKTIRQKPQTIWIFLGCLSLSITYFLGDSWYQGIGLIDGLGDYWIFWGQTIEILFLSIGAIFTVRQMQQDQQKSIYLKELDAAKSRFFTNVSHELKTPLTLMLTPLENSLPLTKNQSVKENLQLAYANGKKLLKLVNEILDLSRLENNKLTLHKTTVDLHQLISRLFASFKSLAQAKNIELKLNYQLPADLWVNTDIEKLERILGNLISNAVKFTNQDGTITLQIMEEEPNRFLITLHNTGEAIPAEVLPYIFNRYYQGKKSTSSFQKGTGIGLAIAQELTQLFKGELTVDSQEKNGTTFRLTLPLEKVVAKTKGAALMEKTTTDPQNIASSFSVQHIIQDKSKILIVEDHREMSRFLVKILSPYYACTTAQDGIEALEKLNQESFDLIISDVMMPRMDGFTLLKKIHEKTIFYHTPVILLTARYLEEDKLQGFQLGVDDYITKPFSSQELIARINNSLKNKSERTKWQIQQQKTEKPVENNSLSPKEQALLQRAKKLILQNLSNSEYKVGQLAKDLHYSQRQLERIIKKPTGLSPVNFIREIRLLQARQLLESQQFITISEVSFAVGFKDAAYFSKIYQKRFGIKPSEVNN